ncbi:hypothetical protein AB0J52_00260 [Spirillospora sp. NPDC049652]
MAEVTAGINDTADVSAPGPGVVRRAGWSAWRNRPTWGAAMFLLAAPGGAQLGLDVPWWGVAAVQWPLYAVLWAAVVTVDLRQRSGRGHRVPAVLSDPNRHGGAS